jgi:hypothetical protein
MLICVWIRALLLELGVLQTYNMTLSVQEKQWDIIEYLKFHEVEKAALKQL